MVVSSPKTLGTWIGIFLAAIFAFIPFRWRDKLARKLSVFAVRKNGRVVRRARVNLAYCFPEKSEQERQEILEETFVKASQYLLGYSEFLVRSTKHNQNRGVMIGEENILPLLNAGENVIILAPHAWQSTIQQ